MENYSGMLIWIIIAIVGIIIVKKIIKKMIGIIILSGILLFSGCIPYSTINSIIDTTTGGYEQITKQAALWHIDENTTNGEKILYILNTIPITLKESNESNENIKTETTTAQ